MDKTINPFVLGPGAILEAADISLEEHIRQAVARATAEGIKANSIVLNSNLVKVPEVFGMTPPMICGLRAYVTELELPDGYAFSVQDDHMDSKPVTNGDRIRTMDDDQLITMLGTNTLCDWIQDNEGAFCDNHATCDGCLKERLRQPAELEDGT